ncbi:MAG: cobalt-precorrin 5A hydrolase [Methanomicrobiales archaeon]|nr:cobalt-precorrin 5A hydrolase [Methanomicrobiales archaeon]
MNDCVVIYLPHSADPAHQVAALLGADLREYTPGAFADIWTHYRQIVAVMACGIVVRALGKLVRDKWTDPAVVVCSPDLRYAVPVLGGHHGANALACRLSSLGTEPVITTATGTHGKVSAEEVAAAEHCEILNRKSTTAVNMAALRGDVPVYRVPGPGIVLAGPATAILVRTGEYTVGIGCRRGVRVAEVRAALEKALETLGIRPEEVLACGTTRKKIGERGLRRGVQAFGAVLVYLDDATLNGVPDVRGSAAYRIGLSGVAEPAALALSREKDLVMEKQVYGRVTVAIAR